MKTYQIKGTFRDNGTLIQFTSYVEGSTPKEAKKKLVELPSMQFYTDIDIKSCVIYKGKKRVYLEHTY